MTGHAPGTSSALTRPPAPYNSLPPEEADGPPRFGPSLLSVSPGFAVPASLAPSSHLADVPPDVSKVTTAPLELTVPRALSYPPRHLAGALTVLGLAVGTALRLWFLFHQPLNSDEAVVGLMARQILHGHFYTFYWGQNYGGAEPYLVAFFFATFGSGWWQLELAPMFLSAISAIFAWRIALRLSGGREIAMLAGMLLFATPEIVLLSSTSELGFRCVTMVCGPAALLFALRIFQGKTGAREFACLGLASGLGWWSSPEIVYFALPSLLLLVNAARTKQVLLNWRHRAAVAVTFCCTGALPWLWANARSGMASLRAAGSHSSFTPNYFGHLAVFFRFALPMELGLRRVGSGAWVIGNGVGIVSQVMLVAMCVVVLSFVAISVILCLSRPNPIGIVGFAALAFPLEYAASPVTAYWQDGRYVVLSSPIFVLLAMSACQVIGQRRPSPRSRPNGRTTSGTGTFSAVCIVSLSLCVISFFDVKGQGPGSFTNGWTDPNKPALATLASLEAAGVRAGYAEYGVAYKLDFLGGGKVAFTEAGGEPDRSTTIDQMVKRASLQAWLFASPSHISIGISQFGPAWAITRPDGKTEATFINDLRSLRVQFRTIHAGLIDAVLTEAPVPPSELRPPLRALGPRPTDQPGT